MSFLIHHGLLFQSLLHGRDGSRLRNPLMATQLPPVGGEGALVTASRPARLPRYDNSVPYDAWRQSMSCMATRSLLKLYVEVSGGELKDPLAFRREEALCKGGASLRAGKIECSRKILPHLPMLHQAWPRNLTYVVPLTGMLHELAQNETLTELS